MQKPCGRREWGESQGLKGKADVARAGRAGGIVVWDGAGEAGPAKPGKPSLS